MMQSDSLMRENLIFLLQNLDPALVQRVSDFTHGLLNAPSTQESDWWDDLTTEEQKELQENLDSLENGTAQIVTNQEVKNRAKLFFDSKKQG